jgi:hypothetical protein
LRGEGGGECQEEKEEEGTHGAMVTELW